MNKINLTKDSYDVIDYSIYQQAYEICMNKIGITQNLYPEGDLAREFNFDYTLLVHMIAEAINNNQVIAETQLFQNNLNSKKR